MSDTSGLSHGPYLGTTTFCSLASLLILLIKASVYSPAQDIGPELSPSLPDHKLNLKKLWGMPVLFLSSLVFALGHVIVAYRTSCRARRKLLIHRIDPESVWLPCIWSSKSHFVINLLITCDSCFTTWSLIDVNFDDLWICCFPTVFRF